MESFAPFILSFQNTCQNFLTLLSWYFYVTGQWFGYTFEENSAGVAFVAEDLPAHMDNILDKRYLHLTNGPFMLEQEA